MKYFLKDCWVEIVAVVLAMVLFIGISMLFSAYGCHSRWEHSGMIPHFGLAQGCQLEKSDGTWIPADNYREVP